MFGTSQATAHATAVLALMQSASTHDRPASEIMTIIRDAADPLEDPINPAVEYRHVQCPAGPWVKPRGPAPAPG